MFFKGEKNKIGRELLIQSNSHAHYCKNQDVMLLHSWEIIGVNESFVLSLNSRAKKKQAHFEMMLMQSDMPPPNMTEDILSNLDAIRTTVKLFSLNWSVIMIIIGFIGHSLNVVVCTRPALWSKPCVRYLFASSIAGYLIIFFLIPSRLLQYAYGINIFSSAQALCKILSYSFSLFK